MPEIRFTVPDHVVAYLKWLSRNIILEKSWNDVGKYLMMRQIERMRRKYHRDEPPLEDSAETPQSSTPKESENSE